MPSFRLTPMALAMASLSMATAVSANQDKDIERISVYGQHNQLILNSGTATKSNMDLIEIPAALVVVSKELIDQQGATDLQEVIRNVSGLNQAGNNYGIGDNLVIRGLGVNYTYDGMYAGSGLGNSFNPTRSMTNVQSIEVLKGPATGLYGIGAAGGVINLVEKRPQREAAYEVEASVGQWDSYQLMLDATGPLNEKLAYRVVANHESSDGYRGLSQERSELFTTLLLDTHENHALTLSGAFTDDSNQVDSIGHPVRILNHDSIQGNPNDWQALINDPNGKGIELTDAQRQELAASIRSTDGFRPYDLGSGSVISPLSKPNEGKEVRIKLKSELMFGNDNSLTQQLQYRDYDSKFSRQTGAFNYVYWNRGGKINANPRAPLVVDGKIYPFAARRQEYRRQYAEEKTWQYFADLQMNWQWGDIEGEHLVSLNHEKRDIRLRSWSIYDKDSGIKTKTLPYILDIRDPNWPTGKFEDYSPSLRTNYSKDVTASGISVQEVVYFNEKLTGRFGGAYTKIKQTYQHLGTDRSPQVKDEADTDDKGFTYNVGLNYRITPQFATFINVAKGRTAYSILGSIDEDQTKNRPDSESESMDLGIRFTAFDEELIGSLVWFDTRRTNLRYNNPLYSAKPGPTFNVSVPQYFYDDEDKTTGVELDLNMDISEALSLNLNATYQDAELTRASNKRRNLPVVMPVKGTPEKFASLWAQYRHTFNGLPGEFAFNLGVTYEDERTINASHFGLPTSVVGSYNVWDGAVSYRQENWLVQLNLNNIFDKTYYSKALFLGGLPGESRNAKLTVKYQF